jgi:hypothetical protein
VEYCHYVLYVLECVTYFDRGWGYSKWPLHLWNSQLRLAFRFSLVSSGFSSSKCCLIYINKTQALKKVFHLKIVFLFYKHSLKVKWNNLLFSNYTFYKVPHFDQGIIVVYICFDVDRGWGYSKRPVASMKFATAASFSLFSSLFWIFLL